MSLGCFCWLCSSSSPRPNFPKGLSFPRNESEIEPEPFHNQFTSRPAQGCFLSGLHLHPLVCEATSGSLAPGNQRWPRGGSHRGEGHAARTCFPGAMDPRQVSAGHPELGALAHRPCARVSALVCVLCECACTHACVFSFQAELLFSYFVAC